MPTGDKWDAPSAPKGWIKNLKKAADIGFWNTENWDDKKKGWHWQHGGNVALSADALKDSLANWKEGEEDELDAEGKPTGKKMKVWKKAGEKFPWREVEEDELDSVTGKPTGKKKAVWTKEDDPNPWR